MGPNKQSYSHKRTGRFSPDRGLTKRDFISDSARNNVPVDRKQMQYGKVSKWIETPRDVDV